MSRESAGNILEVRGIGIRYGSVTAVKQADLLVPEGKIVGLVGESGSGKSTLIWSVIGLLPAFATIHTGSIKFNGKEITHLDENAFRRLRGTEISMVSQDPLSALNPVLTIEQHFADIQYRRNISAQEKRGRALEALESVHIPNAEARLSMYPHQLSGGQKQRVCIAMAVLMKPRLLIADEPTTALDATLEAEIIALLKELQSSINCAMVFVTHHLGVVSSLCDDVVVMRHGAVEEAGAVKQVFNAPKSKYAKDLLRCDPAHIEEKCRRLPTMSRPDLRAVEDKTAAEKRIVRDEPPLLDAKNVRVTFRPPFSLRKIFNPDKALEIKAVDNVSMQLSRGETIAVVGESGSGKTTLIRAMLGLVKAQSGSIKCAGAEVLSANHARLNDVRRQIALVFQDPVGSLSPRMSIDKILREAIERRMDQPRNIKEEIIRLLEMVDLPSGFSSRFPHQLSGGQARRVCIARALAQMPNIIIADEPTAGLDVSVQGEILNLLCALQEKHRFPLLIVTHNLNVVRHIADRVIVMYMGKIVEQGMTENIFDRPRHGYTRRLIQANRHPSP